MHLWHHDATEWKIIPIRDGLRVDIDPHGRVVFGEAASPTRSGISVVPFSEHGMGCAALVSGRDAAVTINGFPPLGLAVLDHKDEIRVFGSGGTVAATFVFGAREVAQGLAFPQGSATTHCARCHRQLCPGDVVTRCQCGAYYHDGPIAPVEGGGGGRNELQCWDYDPRCSECQRLRAEMLWSPNVLDPWDGEPEDGDEERT